MNETGRIRADGDVALVVHPGSATGRAAAERLTMAGAIVRTADTEVCLRADAVQACVDAHGRLDIGVIVHADPRADAPPDPSATDPHQIDSVLRSTFFVAQAAARTMRAGGRLCVAAPPRPLRLPADVPAPATLVEGGLVAMVRLLAVELAPAIRVNAVCPVGADADPDAVAAALAFLASADASYVTGAFVPVPGQLRDRAGR